VKKRIHKRRARKIRRPLTHSIGKDLYFFFFDREDFINYGVKE
jgi:hypothetical protein